MMSGDRTGRPGEWSGAVLLSPPVGQHGGDQPGPATTPQQQQQQQQPGRLHPGSAPHKVRLLIISGSVLESGFIYSGSGSSNLG
jgi:hypothetical protein